MTGARARFGVLVVVIVALLSAGLIGVWAVNRPSTDAPSELARAGIPVSDADTTLDDPELEEERDEQGEGANERVEAYERAKEQGKAGQSGKRTYVKAAAGAAPAARPGSARSRSIRPPTTGSRPSRPTRAPRGSTSSRPATAGEALPGQLPDRPGSPCRSRRTAGRRSPDQAAVRLQGLGPVRPDHRGRARHRCGLRAVHERVQRHVHQVDRPRRDLVGAGQDLRLRVVERQADHRGRATTARTCTSRSTARPAATRGSPSRTTRARRGRRSSSSTRTATTSPSMATSRPTAPSTSARSSLLYGGGGNKGTTPTGTIDEHVFISRDHGATWIDKVVGQTLPGLACTAAGCTPDFYLGHHAVTADAGGNLVFLYDGATTAGGKQSIYATPLDRQRARPGRRRRSLSAAGEEATLPMIESRGNGDVRAGTGWRPRAAATSTPGTP